jgi:hypothetical protein
MRIIKALGLGIGTGTKHKAPFEEDVTRTIRVDMDIPLEFVFRYT